MTEAPERHAEPQISAEVAIAIGLGALLACLPPEEPLCIFYYGGSQQGNPNSPDYDIAIVTSQPPRELGITPEPAANCGGWRRNFAVQDQPELPYVSAVYDLTGKKPIEVWFWGIEDLIRALTLPEAEITQLTVAHRSFLSEKEIALKITSGEVIFKGETSEEFLKQIEEAVQHTFPFNQRLNRFLDRIRDFHRTYFEPQGPFWK